MLINSAFKRRPALLLYLCLILLAVVFVIQLFWHTLFNGRAKGVSHKSIINHPNLTPPSTNNHNGTSVKAAFVILTRNSELDGVRQAIRQMEARFNHKFGYPYVFLNDEPFTDEFKESTSSLTNAETKYGLIPKEHWSYPDWIDIEKADKSRKAMEKEGIIYGGSVSYRHMCRFESGFFYRHPLMEEYDYYWRVEPNVEFYCDLDYDPFLYMQQNNKKYGWTISLLEYQKTIPTLWNTVRSFMKKYPQHIPRNNMLDFVSNTGGFSYNLCHFWSNFEIGDLRFLRGEAYSQFFDYLDQSGGFFYERWGDAPVHSIAVSLFLNKDEIHFFDDIGYRHDDFMHCPSARELQKKCHCDAHAAFDLTENSCFRRWVQL
ncbi:glycosyltransferase family 15 protein [Phascolomyces articulosus]|uniref:Glycosyltransferase family 15 protein n=1 Tax=Phascolomyces articulosus TaxID=60185 RepID=A0AAD5KCB6_9FUNG|nr:glycosyltransferase family 15 protein [Phascolomyces articulosus]